MQRQGLATRVLLKVSICLLVCKWRSNVVTRFVPIDTRSAAKTLDTTRGQLSVGVVLVVPYETTQCFYNIVVNIGAATFVTGTAFVGLLYRTVITTTIRFFCKIWVRGITMFIAENTSGLFGLNSWKQVWFSLGDSWLRHEAHCSTYLYKFISMCGRKMLFLMVLYNPIVSGHPAKTVWWPK